MLQATNLVFDALNYIDFASDLLSASWPWEKIDFEVHSIDECVDELNKLFLSIVDRHIPAIFRRVKRITQAPWMTSEILQAMLQRERAKKMGHERDYKVCRNYVTRLIRSCKCKAKRYQESVEDTACHRVLRPWLARMVEASRGDPRLLSNIFKDLQNKPIHQNAPAYITYHNNTRRKDIDIADSFNDFFSGIATTYLGKPGKDTPQTEQFHLL